MDEARHAFYALVALNVACVLAVAGLAVYVFIDAGNKRAEIRAIAEANNKSLCDLRINVERRVANLQGLLDTHPKAQLIDADPGPARLIVSRALLKQSIGRERPTIDALADLDCKEEA